MEYEIYVGFYCMAYEIGSYYLGNRIVGINRINGGLEFEQPFQWSNAMPYHLKFDPKDLYEEWKVRVQRIAIAQAGGIRTNSGFYLIEGEIKV